MAVMIIQLFQFILFFARDLIMQQKIDLLFENKIGCVANLLGFNDGQREILKTAAWIGLNDLMLSQPKDYSQNELHVAQWLLVIKIGKNVQEMLNLNSRYASNNIWQDLEEASNGRPDGCSVMHLIDYMVERCR